uniref:(California timema) hypothetical protein n=1 Tax=Timema californicum TaxID=61474 RepID=A0A7R9PDA9_TIMCA|nr:unnamed protein product [Timema californicum]
MGGTVVLVRRGLDHHAISLPPLQHMEASAIQLVTYRSLRYTWSVLLDQVEPAFPYISDTGTLPPASCLFSQLLNIITIFMSCCVYIRYRLVKNAESGIIPWVNTMAAWLGGICCLGLSLVANFQESNVSSVHVIGADTCFIGGAIYFCLQTWFSHKMKPSLVSKKTLKFQICMSVLCFLCAVTTILAGNIASAHFHGKKITTQLIRLLEVGLKYKLTIIDGKTKHVSDSHCGQT